MTGPITWRELRDAIAELHEGLLGARHQANEAVWNPPDDRRLDRIYVDAYADLRFEVDGLTRRAEVLVERLAETDPPARPLEAVLADIEAEGHIDIDIRRSPAFHDWEVRSDTDSVLFPGADSAPETRQAWREAIEQGEARGDTPAAAAEARLADIRKLHAEKLDAIKALVGALAMERDQAPGTSEPLARIEDVLRGHKVEFELDGALGTWHYRCAERHVVGGGQFTLLDAILAALAAIDFSLEPAPDAEATLEQGKAVGWPAGMHDTEQPLLSDAAASAGESGEDEG